jgi:hypothetical protein
MHLNEKRLQISGHLNQRTIAVSGTDCRITNIFAPRDVVRHIKPVIEPSRRRLKLGNLLRSYRFDRLERRAS